MVLEVSHEEPRIKTRQNYYTSIVVPVLGLLWPVPNAMMYSNINLRSHMTAHVGLREPMLAGSYLPLRLCHKRSSRMSSVDLEEKP